MLWIIIPAPNSREVATGTVGTDARRLQRIGNLLLGGCRYTSFGRSDVTKFISGCMASLSAMVQLELPHVNILSKMDLVTNKRDIENYLNPEPAKLLPELNKQMGPRYEKLNKALTHLVDQYTMVSFVPLGLRK